MHFLFSDVKIWGLEVRRSGFMPVIFKNAVLFDACQKITDKSSYFWFFRLNGKSRSVNLYTIERITVGTGMPLNSHRRYQKVCISNVNHERGYQFEHILAPTLPEFQNKLRELHQWTPASSKGPQDHLLITRYACFVQVTAKNKHDFLAGDGIFCKRPDIGPMNSPILHFRLKC